MKYIKKFEGRNIKVNLTEEEILSAYKDECEDLDDRSYITFDEFFESLDFDIFLKHDDSKFYNSCMCASRCRSNFRGSFEIDIKGSRMHFFESTEYGPTCPAGLERSLDWKKRNVFFYAEVNTGGASGGSCWDTDDGAQSYEGGRLDLNDFIFSYLNPILNDILASHANEKSPEELCQILYNNPSIIKEGYRCDSQYYGNYDDYSCYYITLGDLYKFLSENNSF